MVYWRPIVVHIISIQTTVFTHNSYVISSKIYIHSNIILFYMFRAYMHIIRSHCLNYITVLLVAIQIYRLNTFKLELS
jgi:hypothetical protein